MSENITGDTKAALDFARATTEPRVLKVIFEGTEEEVLVTTGANGATEKTPIRKLFADRAAAPARRSGTIVVHDLTSFSASTNRDSSPDSVIFADVPSRKLTAVLDFHARGGGAPHWARDRIEYGFQFSPQLMAWCEAARQPMDQKTFARLIDDRLGDVAADPPEVGSVAAEFAARRGIRFASIADLLVFTRTIATKSNVESEEMVDDNTGDISIQYKKKGDVKTNDGKPIAVPPAFALRIPILCGLAATQYTIAVRLRYDITERGIAWRIELNALEQYVLAAIGEAVAIVERPKADGGCELPVFMGTAPAT